VAHGVGELGLDDFAVLEVDGEGLGGSLVGFANLDRIIRELVGQVREETHS